MIPSEHDLEFAQRRLQEAQAAGDAAQVRGYIGEGKCGPEATYCEGEEAVGYTSCFLITRGKG